ncbi:response regulator transcription factor [Paenalkalicoccus suaedae]|uniref:Response regulator transcription factor n=1 Tax=Paenalkalicoccus suaedae TaxID=2592382 RepID=A0A859FI44_9BACI|nr:response regulator [Paenalkalicoccus suaedae]QKS72518.1 response regulator transcription factor [Paenalkalicoccus suaedae]
MSTNGLLRVMVVDDEHLIRQGIKHYFNWEEKGFTIAGEASNGQEALNMIEDIDPHIIVTDIVMPIMDGEELTKRVKRDYPAIQMIVLSSYGEFDYVRATFQLGVVDYILKPKLEPKTLLDVLTVAAERVQPSVMDEGQTHAARTQALLEKILLGFATDADFESGLFQEAFPYEAFLLMRESRKEQSTTSPMDQLVNGLDTSRTIHMSLQLKDGDTLHLLQANDREALQRSVVAELPTRTVVCSRVMTNPMELAQAASQLEACMKQVHFYFPQKRVVVAGELDLTQGHEEFDVDAYMLKLREQRYQEAAEGLITHVQAMMQTPQLGPNEFRTFLTHMIFTTAIILHAQPAAGETIEKEKYTYMTAINEAETAERATEALTVFLQKVTPGVRTKDTHDTNMKLLQDYIAEHYMEPLSLKELASHFHFHPSYLSSYFSAHNKEGFSEYLTSIRIEESKKLLKHSGMPIAEISHEVGYSDHSYYCKVFKKDTGVSPSQYRRDYLLKGQEK